MKLKRIIFNNFWLKVIALIIAIIIWIYVSGEVSKEIIRDGVKL